MIARRGSANYQKESICKHTALIDKCKNKHKHMLNYQCWWVKKIMEHVKTILKKKSEKYIIFKSLNECY